MGFNIYEDTVDIAPRRRASSAASNSHEENVACILEDIFAANASAGGPSGTLFEATFPGVCTALAKAFPDTPCAELVRTDVQARAWDFFDVKNDRIITLEEFTTAVNHMLKPNTAQAILFLARLKGPKPEEKRPRQNSGFEHIKRVAILGGGVAGLQTANLLKRDGIDCTIFEKAEDIGGVWRENYADFGLQVPKELYEFPGFPYPKNKEWSLFPPGHEVQEYIQCYAKEFGLYDLCKFQTAVLEATPGSEGRGWTVRYQKKGEIAEKEHFDYLVVASGMYGWPPHIPVAAGADCFKGEIQHSCTFTDRDQAKGKKVVVVGGGKSAIDCAVAAVNGGAKSSTLLFREPHWPVPRYLANLVPFKWGTYSRFGHSTLPTHHKEASCFWWLHSTCAPMKWVWWRVVETMFTLQFKIPKDQRPKQPIEEDLFNGGQILTYQFRDMCGSDKISSIIGSIDHFEEDGVVLGDGSKIETDMVIYATGFAKSYDLFDKHTVQPKLGVEKDGLWLYRNIIPPKLKDVAFIGSEVSTFNNILTHGLQALWLQRYLSGAITRPKPSAMEKEVDLDKAWKRSWMPPSSARASIWQLHMLKYHDILLQDMGERPKRKGFNVVGEVFAPYSARDYTGLFQF